MNTKSFLVGENGKVNVEASAPKTSLKIDQILVGCWGYEACLATFVKVVKVCGKSVKVVELAQHQTGGWEGGTALPDIFHPVGEIVTKMVKFNHDGRPYLKWNSYNYLYIWNGEAIHTYNHH